MGSSLEVNRPRNVDWKRAAALLYGDWGTSKAYVIGLAFAAAGFSSLPIIVAVSALTAIVGFNYIIVCKHFPDGGGVYSAAKEQSRFLAAVGALLLVANFLVTADVSGWASVSYFGVPPNLAPVATMVLIGLVGLINYFGPKHSGSLSIWLAVPTVITVAAIIGVSIPHLTTQHLQEPHTSFTQTWVAFVGVILALSGVEAVANITGVMKLDPDSPPGSPRVTRTATKSILPVAVEVVLGTVLLGWAMLSLPSVMTGSTTEIAKTLLDYKEDMLRLLGEKFAAATVAPWFGSVFGVFVGIIFGLLLFSAVNTAIVALIGVLYMMAIDGDMPRQMTRLNRYGVPTGPLLIAMGLPILVLTVTRDFETLAGLYAIGVVGAITVNLGSCTFNKRLQLQWYERTLMGGTFLVLFAVELTLARTKPDALFFALCVLGIGLGLRAWSHKTTGLRTITITREIAEVVSPAAIERLRPKFVEGQRIMVAARGVTPVLRFALDEARLRKATLCVLYVKEIAVFMTGPTTAPARPRWQEDPEAAAIMSLVLKLGEEMGVDVLPVYAVSTDPASTILDLAATMGVDYLMLGAAQRFSMAKLLKGNVVEKVASGLPEDIQLVIHG
jgi:amino acid transporter/nucleotide-binding universal stress UspA family protein